MSHLENTAQLLLHSHLSRKVAAQSRLLALPSEVRVMIYHFLFADQIVTLSRSRHTSIPSPQAIMSTCHLSYQESLPIFYDLATISLKHETYLHLLQRMIGDQNMARLRNVSVGGYAHYVTSSIMLPLPSSLKKLYFRWTPRPKLFTASYKAQLDDEEIKYLLDQRRRQNLGLCVTELWNKNPNLLIYFDAIVLVSYAPSGEVCSRQNSPSAVPTFEKTLLTCCFFLPRRTASQNLAGSMSI